MAMAFVIAPLSHRGSMVPGRLIYCPPAAKDWTYRPFLPLNRTVRTRLLGIKLSSGGTLTTFIGQKPRTSLS